VRSADLCAVTCRYREASRSRCTAGGEQRISGFLLWQASSADLCFAEANWPGFPEIDLLRAIRTYAAPVLTGWLDQSALCGVLAELKSLGLVLIEVPPGPAARTDTGIRA
jgi:Putative undecaprenyl diphosphate synthase